MKMKEHAILSNAGHFNVEIDMKWLEENASEKKEARENIMAYKLPNGTWINVIAEGRLVNICLLYTSCHLPRKGRADDALFVYN